MANNIFDRNFVKTRVEQEKRGDNPATRCPFGCGNIARIRVIDNRRDTVHLCCIVCAKKFIELHGEGCGQLLADEIVRLTQLAPDRLESAPLQVVSQPELFSTSQTLSTPTSGR